MSTKLPGFPGIVVSVAPGSTFIESLNEATAAWEMRAARGECAWVCSDCCMTFPAGMPDACGKRCSRATPLPSRR